MSKVGRVLALIELTFQWGRQTRSRYMYDIWEGDKCYDIAGNLTGGQGRTEESKE